MADSIESVREEYSNALEAFQAAAAAIEEFDPEAEVEEGADAPSLDELEATFTGAEEDYKATSAKLELFKRTQEARSIALPDTPGAGDVRITNEPAIYSRELAQREGRSIFRDLYNRDVKHDSAAGERIASHGRQMADRAEFDLSSTDAAGGYLVAPLYLQDEYISLARAGRVTADVLGPKPLPPNTDSINVPRMTTGTAVAVQADNNAVQETDAAFGTLAADVKTIAGLQDVSQQLIDRGVPGVDEVIFADLAKAYAVKLDTDVLNSATANNKGLLQVGTPYTSTYTAATPTVSGLYSKIADAIQGIETNVYTAPDAIIMHPRRWAWILAASDTTNRPLVTPYAPMNAVGELSPSHPVAQGAVGSLQGVPVYTDPNVVTTAGASTTEDKIIVLPRAEEYLWEEPAGPFLDTFRDVGSGNLTVRFRLFNYYAQMYERRDKQHAVISGTGLIAPTF
jgi:HK97 family phage major capsid protein